MPGAGLVRTSKRPTPRILAPDKILALMEAARALGPRDALRPHTVATVIGLLASCGLRAGEAIRLDGDHVDLGRSWTNRIAMTTASASPATPSI